MENTIAKIEDFNANALVEIKGKNKMIAKLIKENPYIEISDTPTFDIAKKSRTALRTCRTDFEKEEKSLLNAIKNRISDPIKAIYQDFKETLNTVEEKQQNEVKRYENVLDEKRKEKERLEEERKDIHRRNIELIYNSNKTAIENLNFETVTNFKLNFVFENKTFDVFGFEEFADVFEVKVEMLQGLLLDKKLILQEKENIRLAQEKIDTQNAENLRIEGIKNKIESFYTQGLKRISDRQLEGMLELKTSIETHIFDCGEFQELFNSKKRDLIIALNAKLTVLQESEKQFLAAEKSKAILIEQQTKTFEIRTRRLSEIGFVLSEDNAEFHNNLTGSFTIASNIFEQDEISFEEILNLEKQLIEKIKSLPVAPEDAFVVKDTKILEVKFEEEAPEITDDAKTIILSILDDLVVDFTFVNRKELLNAIENGKITIDEMVAEFKKLLQDNLQ